MHVFQKDDIKEPFASQHGETVYELIGRVTGDKTQNHSLAHVSIAPGKASLNHYHPEAEESYYILKGKAKICVGEEETEILPGQSVLIPPTKPHKIYNIGEDDLEFLAICVPAWEPENSVWLEK